LIRVLRLLGGTAIHPINREARINRKTGDTQRRRVQAAGLTARNPERSLQVKSR